MKRFLYIATLAVAAWSFTTGCAFFFGDGSLGGSQQLPDEDAVDLVAAEVAPTTGGSAVTPYEALSTTGSLSIQDEMFQTQQTRDGKATITYDNGRVRGVREYSYTLTYQDSNGEETSSGEATQIAVEGSVSGDSERLHGTGEFESTVDLTLTEITDGDSSATVNGVVRRTGSGSFRRSETETDVTYASDVTVRYREIVADGAVARENEFPESGSMEVDAEYSITGDSGERNWSGTVTVTFDGTREATARVNGSSYTIDLENGTLVE